MNIQQIAANPLPQYISSAASVAFNNTFLLIGGYNGTNGNLNPLATIHQYNVEEDKWIKLSSQLSTPRSSHVSLLVPQSLFPNCTEIV